MLWTGRSSSPRKSGEIAAAWLHKVHRKPKLYAESACYFRTYIRTGTVKTLAMQHASFRPNVYSLHYHNTDKEIKITYQNSLAPILNYKIGF